MPRQRQYLQNTACRCAAMKCEHRLPFAAFRGARTATASDCTRPFKFGSPTTAVDADDIQYPERDRSTPFVGRLPRRVQALAVLATVDIASSRSIVPSGGSIKRPPGVSHDYRVRPKRCVLLALMLWRPPRRLRLPESHWRATLVAAPRAHWQARPATRGPWLA